MKVIPIKEGGTCQKHAFYSKQSGDLSAQGNPPAIWYFEIGGRDLWLCDNCKNTLNRISGGPGDRVWETYPPEAGGG